MGKDDDDRKFFKRKRQHEEDNVHHLKPKRRREAESEYQVPEDVYNEERDDPSDLNRTVSSQDGINSNDDYVVYLVRKPVKLTLDELAVLPLPKKLKKPKTIDFETDNGLYCVQTGSKCERMLHISTETASVLNSKAVKPDGPIHALITIMPTEPKDLNLGQIFEEGDDVPHDVELPKIKSIRKKPKNKPRNYELSERLVAFGNTMKKRHRFSLPCLRKPAEAQMSSSSTPSEVGAGGSDMSDGIMAVVRPIIETLDGQVQKTRQSQVALSDHIETLANLLHEMSQDEPFDLNVYARKLDDSKRRLGNVAKVLESLHERLGQLQRVAQEYEKSKKKDAIETGESKDDKPDQR